MTGTQTLAEFLSSQYAGEEARARLAAEGADNGRYNGETVTLSWKASRATPHEHDVWLDGPGQVVAVHLGRGVGEHIAAWNPKRVLTECAAKRRMLEQAFAVGHLVDGEWGDGHTAEQIRVGLCSDHGNDSALEILRTLALPYAEHPDYRQEWAL